MKKAAVLLRILNHPTDEYEELKYRKTWSLPLSFILLVCWVIAEILQKQVTDFKFNTHNTREFNVLYVLASTIVLFAMWVVINWSITTLLEGKGRIKEIWVSCAYALVPYIATTLLCVVLSHMLTLDESAFLTVIRVLGLLYSFFLLITALKVVHSYTFGKTLLCILITVLGMAFVLFLIVLFFGLIQQVILFFQTIYMELMFRR